MDNFQILDADAERGLPVRMCCIKNVRHYANGVTYIDPRDIGPEHKAAVDAALADNDGKVMLKNWRGWRG